MIKKLKALKRRSGFLFNSDKFLDLLLDYYHGEKLDKICTKFVYELGILSDGRMAFCAQSGYLGNIRKSSIKAAWYSREAVENRKKLKNCNDCFINCNYAPPLVDLLKDFFIYPTTRKIRSILRIQ